jgi:proteic killer suppression protein
MDYGFETNKLKKQFKDASSIKQAFGPIAKKIMVRLDDIKSSPTLATLRQLPAANCHKLTGKRSDQWAVDVSGNYRIIFELDHDPIPMQNDTEIDFNAVTRITIVEVIDYH